MSLGYVLYNSKAGSQNDTETLRALEVILNRDLKYIDVLSIKNYAIFLSGLQEDDILILAGGDGTLNRFVNDTDGIDFHNEILYFPNGTGNDFAHDMGCSKECVPFPVTDHLKTLPQVKVKGKTYRFVNGIGYGIDGYCCEAGDTQRAKTGKPINYTAIAVKGLLFHYTPVNATVTVDGRSRTYRNVWLAPTMNGRFYGGGMMPTPNQKRNSGTLSTMVFHSAGKLKTLLIFPSLFKGEHVKHTDCVEVLEGKTITVEYDRPCALQIDGETISDVRCYTAFATVPSVTTASKA